VDFALSGSPVGRSIYFNEACVFAVACRSRLDVMTAATHRAMFVLVLVLGALLNES
jgi:hypothetical protein